MTELYTRCAKDPAKRARPANAFNIIIVGAGHAARRTGIVAGNSAHAQLKL